MVVIYPPCVKEAKVVNKFEVMEKAACPGHNRFKSQFQLIDVIGFQQGYDATSNNYV